MSPRGALLSLAALLVLTSGGESRRRQSQGRLVGRPYTRLEFRDLGCGGLFDRALVARLTIVCRGCSRMYQDPELFGLCRQDCFSSRFFVGCVQALHIVRPEDKERLASAARALQG